MKNRNKLQFWVIDDDPVFRFTIRHQLRKMEEKWELQEFENAVEAARYLKENQRPIPLVILLDIHMPEMDGWEFLDWMIQEGLNNGKEIYIYVVSSSVSELDLEKSLKYPMIRQYVSKPLQTGLLQFWLQTAVQP
jgi:CheY-like chemotaxis protein